MSKIIFITGTDTGIGKTYISTGLLRIANAKQFSTIGIKPVSSGCLLENGKIYNSDALLLQDASSIKLDYDIINPFAFLPPIAPHIIATQQHIDLSVATLMAHTQPALSITASLHLIEGFGGWHAPLNNHETMADYAIQLGCEVLLVVGIRLGCINHSILTERAINASGLRCTGWIANVIDSEMTHQEENIETLKAWLSSPLLGVVRHNESVEEALQHRIIF